MSRCEHELPAVWKWARHASPAHPACPSPAPVGAAAFLEILSEPLYILAAARLQFGLRVAVETVAMGAKGLLTLALVRRPAYPPAIAFSWAQLAYAGITLLGYAAYFLPQLLKQAAGNRQPAAAAAEAKQPPATAVAAGSEGEILRLAGTFTLQVGGGWRWMRQGAQNGSIVLLACLMPHTYNAPAPCHPSAPPLPATGR